MAGSLEQRPYAGTWEQNNRRVVKYTPDALVFVNGDVSLPGCARCRGRVDLQQFVTGMSVDAGTDPTSHSATINLSLPRVQGQQLFIDGYNVLQPGLEIHIFMRGYFPTSGLFTHVGSPDIEFPNAAGGSTLDLSNFASYPYYPVFHGVVTQVSYEYSDGFYHGTLNCASLLHFWRFQNISTSAAHLAERPLNDFSRPTLFGHVFNGMHPFGIIYTLYRDVAGAAAGAEFALSEESNLTESVSSNSDAQLYDQMTLYWESRFRTRIQNLRMYGVNGQLFNAAQQAYFVSSTQRDIERNLPNTQFGDPETQRTESDPFAFRYSTAKALGLANAGIDVVYAPFLNQQGNPVNVSLLDMWAFSPTLSQVGEVNLWQTTYQTKMDIAQKVCEITGYELYQDVDGDIVFKPPFYNLDTSTNRYYRLEDIDVISASFQEKEPNATYITVNGTWFKGMGDIVGNADATRKRGFFADYKLISQFGWRPATLEITYVVDPKVLFYIGVARMDLLNVDVNSASVTIPVRSELRPGYPVYIPFVDSFYYIQQISHSFQFGGTCTTSLTLTCRRRKFHAPGFLLPASPGTSAIDLIRLDRPDLPKRPLIAHVNGQPRYVGFPNVVLALDPTKFNPNYSAISVGLDYLTSIEKVDEFFSLLQRDALLLHPNVLRLPAEYLDVDGRVRPNTVLDPQAFILDDGTPEGKRFTLEDLRASYKQLDPPLEKTKNIRNERNKLLLSTGGLQENQQREVLFNKFSEEQAAGGKNPPVFDRSSILKSQTFDDLGIQGALLSGERELQTVEEDNLLLQVLGALQKGRGRPGRRTVDGLPGSEVTLAYYDTLSHLKGQFASGATLPGHYRYYSCSHPDPVMQGQPIIRWSPPPAEKKSVLDRLRLSPKPERSLPTQSPAFLEKQLDQRLSSANITFVKGVRGDSRTRLLLAESKAAKVPLTDPQIATNLANIAVAGQELVRRFEADPRTKKFRDLGGFLAVGSAWRPGSTVEDSGDASQHAAGRALDIEPQYQNPKTGNRVRPGYIWGVFGRTTNSPNFQAFIEALPALFEHANAMWQEGLIGGVGFYPLVENKAGNPANNGFVHIDSRERKSGKGSIARWVRPLSLRKSVLDDLDSKTGFVDLKTVKDRVGNRIKVFPVTISEPFSEPQPAPPEEKVEIQEPPPPPPPSGQIETQEISLEAGRTVVQFKRTLDEVDENLVPPEVVLTTGKCFKGLNVAVGEGRPPILLTTDQIQTLSFSAFPSSTVTQVVGNSVSSGSIPTFSGQNLTTRISETLERESSVAVVLPFLGELSIVAPGVSEQGDLAEKTPLEVFKLGYDEAKRQVEAINVPVFEGQTLEGVLDEELFSAIAEGRPAKVGSADPGAVTEGSGTATVEIKTRKITIPEFEVAIPPIVLPEGSPLQALFEGESSVQIAEQTFSKISRLPGYASSTSNSGTSQTLQPTVETVRSAYARVITQAVTLAFDESRKSAISGTLTTGREKRLDAVRRAFGEVIASASGANEAVSEVQGETPSGQKAVKQGVVDTTVHTPIFPVSDEKGYEHFGAFRYGRGLTVDPGGTFEFIHSGQDPFNNVTPETAEAFVQALTLSKAGLLEGVQGVVDRSSAAVVSALSALVTNTESSETDENLPQVPSASERLRRDTQVALEDVIAVAEGLIRTPRGEAALRELLEANGDDPNLISQPNWSVEDTQFARNFANFAVSYGKSPVFKTTVSNAAFRLSDLTTHLLDRAGSACQCRGAHADVMFQAWDKKNFITVPGVSPGDPATAENSEQIILSSGAHIQRQDHLRDSNLDPSAVESFNRKTATSLGVPSGEVASPGEVVSAESNPPTTADPSTLPDSNVNSNSGVSSEDEDAGIEDVSSSSEEEGLQPLNSEDTAVENEEVIESPDEG